MYPVCSIVNPYQLEQLGTKEKYWFLSEERSNEKTLCKIGRAGTGENWSEKIAYELAKLLGLPCAAYELAMYEGKQAVLSPSFVREHERLIHGNELLTKIESGYDETQAFQLRQYKLSTVIAFWQTFNDFVQYPLELQQNIFVQDVLELFIAYLLFDAWIGNQDHHDQNWGIILGYPDAKAQMRIAPSFDHASSLACRMSVSERQKRLKTRDVNYSIKSYAAKAHTPFFNSNGQKRLKTFECVAMAVSYSRKQRAMSRWRDRLISIKTEEIETILAKIPPFFGMNAVVADFTLQYLEANKQFLLELEL